MALRLDTDITYLKGVGPKLGDLFHRKGIKTIQDLLEFYPRAYEDQRAARNIASLQPNDIVSIKGRIVSVNSINMGRSTRKMYEVLVRDASGSIRCKFFRVPYRGYFERFTVNKEVRVVGKVTDYRGRLEFHHPDIRDVEPEEETGDKLIPLYTEIEGLASAKIAKLVQSALANLQDWPTEKFPKWILEQYNLLAKKDALLHLHQPAPERAKELLEYKSKAQRRIIFEEFFWLELYLAAKKTGLKKDHAPEINSTSALSQKLIKSLPFALTSAQIRVFEEIKKDLRGPHPMHRMVQGDVGSGKTMVSFLAVATAVEAQYQACLMAPTEILAEQHFRNAEKVLAPLGIRLALLTGKSKASERKTVAEDLASGKVQFLIGTHALLEDWVQFQKLGLVIVDEQHRFGVEQRGALKNKGQSPHFLIMTATPIPRTLAMTVYGDLDVSIINEMPPGRSPIQTRVTFASKKDLVLGFMMDQLKKGRQAYIVYPLVEESEKMDLKDAISEYEALQQRYPEVKFGLLHGKMKSAEKDSIMESFRRCEIQVLVSTTVIEVGVDVPNANIMIIEHAERFGLSQLHQLRGRVGRGAHKSFCIMVLGHAISDEARARTQLMEQTTDGFKIAEFDLEMRGPGEFMGTKQSGLSGFKMANLVRDLEILLQAREAAFKVLESDPNLKKVEHLALKQELLASRGPTALAGIA
ncbi:MAG: ATP-dependent DNA helicase RecG [Bdellovibrionia bacterium]